MSTKCLLLSAAVTLTFLTACTVYVASPDAASTPERRAMAVCGLGLIETPEGPKPAIAGMNPSPEVYREYARCLQKFMASEQQSRSGDSR